MNAWPLTLTSFSAGSRTSFSARSRTATCFLRDHANPFAYPLTGPVQKGGPVARKGRTLSPHLTRMSSAAAASQFYCNFTKQQHRNSTTTPSSTLELSEQHIFLNTSHRTLHAYNSSSSSNTVFAFSLRAVGRLGEVHVHPTRKMEMQLVSRTIVWQRTSRVQCNHVSLKGTAISLSSALDHTTLPPRK